MRKYVVSWSSRPKVRTTLRMYVPTPNSVIRRMSMAIFTGAFNHRVKARKQRNRTEDIFQAETPITSGGSLFWSSAACHKQYIARLSSLLQKVFDSPRK